MAAQAASNAAFATASASASASGAAASGAGAAAMGNIAGTITGSAGAVQAGAIVGAAIVTVAAVSSGVFLRPSTVPNWILPGDGFIPPKCSDHSTLKQGQVELKIANLSVDMLAYEPVQLSLEWLFRDVYNK